MMTSPFELAFAILKEEWEDAFLQHPEEEGPIEPTEQELRRQKAIEAKEKHDAQVRAMELWMFGPQGMKGQKGDKLNWPER